MSVEKVKHYFAEYNMAERVKEVKESSATVEEAAMALSCAPARIAKTLSFYLGNSVILIVTAGDCKIDNKKYKDHFGQKAQMLKHDDVESLTGYTVGGVCPFALNPGVRVYLDVSLRRFETVFPAAGSANSMIELTIDELKRHSYYKEWVDVCKTK